MSLNNQQKFDFNDINLMPKKCIVNSRSECDTSIVFGNFKFKMPIVPANMECIINEDLAIKLASNGYFYIMHRFDINQIDFIGKMKKLNLISSISVGVNDDSFLLINTLKNSKLLPDFITIDIAHGHCIKMEKMIKHIKENLPNSFVIAGNVSSVDGVRDIDSWGADSIKVGIGPGMACTTWPNTGFGSRNCQASTIWNCSMFTSKPIIADGGIRTPGDIAKSIVLGASMVMVGGMLSGFEDSPGNCVSSNEGTFKEFWGSASVYQSGKNNRIEGKKILIPYKNHSIFEELNHIEECLQSSISYGGGNALDCLTHVSWY